MGLNHIDDPWKQGGGWNEEQRWPNLNALKGGFKGGKDKRERALEREEKQRTIEREGRKARNKNSTFSQLLYAPDRYAAASS